MATSISSLCAGATTPDIIIPTDLQAVVKPEDIQAAFDRAAGSHPLAILGGPPTFLSDNPVPLIFPSGYGYVGEHSAVDVILGNEHSTASMLLPSRQRYVSKGVTGPGSSHRSNLQRRLEELLGLSDAIDTSVICLSKGTHALRAAVKALLLADGEPTSRKEVIVPATTVASTAEAVIMEGFVPVLTDVDRCS